MRVASEGGCNIYYLESGLCKAGVLDDIMTFTKPGVNFNNIFRAAFHSLSCLIQFPCAKK
jgi:hypothetical protein